MSDKINIKQLSQLSEIEIEESDIPIIEEQIENTLKNIEKLFECELPENQKMWKQQSLSMDQIRDDKEIEYANPQIRPIEVNRMVKKGSK